MMPVDFEVHVTDLFGHVIEKSEIRVPITYNMTTPEREALCDTYRDKIIDLAKAGVVSEDYGTDQLRIVVWGKKTRFSNGQVTSWRAFEIFRRGEEIRCDWLDQCDYLNLKTKPSGKR